MPELPHDPGPLLNAGAVVRHVRDRLTAWTPWYLARVDEQEDPALLPHPTAAPTWWLADDDVLRPEQRPPAGLVVNTGSIGEYDQRPPRGRTAMWWQINVGFTVGGATDAGVQATRDRTAAAVRGVLAQQLVTPDGPIDATYLIPGEEPAEVNTGGDRPRRLAAYLIPVAVRTPSAVDTTPGLPVDPPPLPSDRPTYPVPTDATAALIVEPTELDDADA